jgi:integrase
MPRSLSPELDELRADPTVRKWESNLREGATSTAEVFVKRLRAVCALLGRTPAQLARLSHDELQDLFIGFRESETKRGSTPPYIAHELTVLRSFLKFAGAPVPTGIKVKGSDRPHEEDALSREEVRRALAVATPRERLAIAVMSQAGVRPEVLGSYDGSDGLRVRDLPDLTIKGGRASFGCIPAVVMVRSDLSKADHHYVTFLGTGGASAVADSITSRIASGEKVGKDSPILAASDRSTRRFLPSIEVGRAVQRAFRAAGLHRDRGDPKSAEPRCYALRTTFAVRMTTAEGDGAVGRGEWQYWFGHKGDMTDRYSKRGTRLDETLLQQMRAAYARAEKYVAFDGEGSTADIKRDLVESLVKAVEEATGGQTGATGTMSADDLIVALRRTLGASGGRSPSGAPSASAAPPRGCQKLVAASELEGLLQAGWHYVAPVGERVVVEPPA